MRGKIGHSAQHHVRARTDVQPNAVVGEEAHDGRIVRRCDAVLYLVSLEKFDRATEILTREFVKVNTDHIG